MKTDPFPPAALRGSGNVPGWGLFLQVLLGLTCLLHCHSQDARILQVEQLLYLDEEASCPDDLLLHWQELNDHPLDINSAGYSELEGSGLFTTYQIQMFLQYRDHHGALLSIYELTSVKGFSVQRLQKIAPFLRTGTPGKGIQMKRMPLHAYIYSGKTWPEASGYHTEEGKEQAVYTGSPWKASIRIRGGLSSTLSLGLAMEKDAGERALQNRLPPHVKGYLHYRSRNQGLEVLAGTFRMQLGLGLIQGSSTLGVPEVAGTGPLYLSRVRPYAGVTESGYLQGLAIHTRPDPFRISLWASLLPRDLSFHMLPDSLASSDWISRIRDDGLHRTSGELAGKNLLFLGSVGTQLLYRHKGLTAGILYSGEYIRLTRRAQDSLQTAISPALHHQVSLHWKWQREKWLLFGELVPGREKTRAMKTGFRYHLNDFLQSGVMYYQYGVSHRDVFAASYGSGSHLQNETGLVICLHAEPARQFSAEVSSGFFHYPFPRHGIDQASSGFRQHILFQSMARGQWRWQCSLTHTSKQHSPASETAGPAALLSTNLTRLDGRIILFPEGKMKLMTRMVLNFCPRIQTQTAGAFVQQANLQVMRSLKLKLQFVVFRIPSWEQRIYIHEPGLYQQFSFPVYAGAGQKSMLACQWETRRWLTVEGKISCLSYSDRQNIGSGPDQVSGHRKIRLELQIRLKR